MYEFTIFDSDINNLKAALNHFGYDGDKTINDMNNGRPVEYDGYTFKTVRELFTYFYETSNFYVGWNNYIETILSYCDSTDTPADIRHFVTNELMNSPVIITGKNENGDFIIFPFCC